jgi:hypothetical protein
MRCEAAVNRRARFGSVSEAALFTKSLLTRQCADCEQHSCALAAVSGCRCAELMGVYVTLASPLGRRRVWHANSCSVWGTADGSAIAVLLDDGEAVHACDISPDGRHVATASVRAV